jgi:glycosyltransferase involved in cell wall biosynthesis
MFFYSIIIPVYNRPDELSELLATLAQQTYKNFEVLVIEDGSIQKADTVVEQFAAQLDIQYHFKENTGQGFSRNYGFDLAKGDYFIVFDSDCLIPEEYLQTVDDYLAQNKLDAYGGPDSAHPDFTDLQKAISYSMTSLFTTGGIRGSKKRTGVFHPRSFNMGISKAVFEKTKGYIITRKGEDIEFSIRIMEQGFKVGLIPEAFVYHKRRTSLIEFFKQLHFFGEARVNISRYYPSELKLVHLFPLVFLIGLLAVPVSYFLLPSVFSVLAGAYVVYFTLILVDATIKNKSLWVGILSIITSAVQLVAYGLGMSQEGLKKLIKG